MCNSSYLSTHVEIFIGAVLEKNIWGQYKKVGDLFLVGALKTQAKTTKSTTPTLQKTPPV